MYATQIPAEHPIININNTNIKNALSLTLIIILMNTAILAISSVPQTM